MNLFQLLRIKIHIDCTPIWNKLPNTFKISPDQQHYFGAELILTGTEPLFWGVRVAVIYPFSSHVTILQINLSSMRLPISWWQISTLHWACWGVNSWGTVWFSKCLNLAAYGTFWCTKVLLTAYKYLFVDFLLKLWCPVSRIWDIGSTAISVG